MGKLIFALFFVVLGYAYYSPYQSCKTDHINTILTEQKEYQGKRVRINGIVQSGVGFLGVGGFQVKSNTGSMMVVTTAGIPDAGDDITIEGVFRQVVNVGNFSKPAVIETSIQKRSLFCRVVY